MKCYLVLALILTVFSCKQETQLSYKIRNSRSTPIKFFSTTMEAQTVLLDSFLVTSNNYTTGAVINKGSNHVGSYMEKGATMQDFSKMEIFKEDNTKSNSDFLKTSRWKYEAKNKHNADYVLTVSPSDF